LHIFLLVGRITICSTVRYAKTVSFNVDLNWDLFLRCIENIIKIRKYTENYAYIEKFLERQKTA